MFFDEPLLIIGSVTENGFAVRNEERLTPAEAVNDSDRIEYYRDYTQALVDAVNIDKVEIKSYFAWSMLSWPTSIFEMISHFIRARFP